MVTDFLAIEYIIYIHPLGQYMELTREMMIIIADLIEIEDYYERHNRLVMYFTDEQIGQIYRQSELLSR